MVNSSNVSELVSQAWHHQRNGNTDTAIAEFEKIVNQHPRDIDAIYGLGLSQKTAGQHEAALKSFKTALELVEENKNSYEATRDPSQDGENVRTPEDDRFQMLSRMVQQRLAELQG